MEMKTTGLGRVDCCSTSIAIRDVHLSMPAGKPLNEEDKKGDIELTKEELVGSLEDMRARLLKLKKLLALLVVLLVLVACIALGLVWVVLNLQKDFSVMDNALVDKNTGHPLQVRSNMRCNFAANR